MQVFFSLCPPNPNKQDDQVAWKCSTDGSFSISSAYSSLVEEGDPSRSSLFKKIWSWPGPERIQILLWKVAQDAILTIQQRERRRILDSVFCVGCVNMVESTLHAVRDCPIVKSVWLRIGGSNLAKNFFQSNKDEWLLQNIAIGSK